MGRYAAELGQAVPPIDPPERGGLRRKSGDDFVNAKAEEFRWTKYGVDELTGVSLVTNQLE